MPYQLAPVVVGPPDFNPIDDAEILRLAIKNARNMRIRDKSKETIINILTTRTNRQRQEIAQEYNNEFGRILIDDLDALFFGPFWYLISALLTPIEDYLCKELNAAMAGWGTDEDALIEILCPRTNQEIESILDNYERIYNSSLLKDIDSEVSGDLLLLLHLIVSGARNDEGEVDPERAHRDAAELYRDRERILATGAGNTVYGWAIARNSFAQLRLIFEEYKKISGHTINEAIEEHVSGGINSAIVAVVECVQNRAKWFAKRLNYAMAGLGTDENMLTRILVTRCEIDLQNIIIEYEKIYGRTLECDIRDDVSKDYLNMLLSILGPSTNMQCPANSTCTLL